MHKTINHCESFLGCHLEGLLFILSVIRFFFIFTIKFNSMFFVYVFNKKLLMQLSNLLSLNYRRMKIWNLIFKINIFLRCEIVCSLIYLCEIFEELTQIVIQVRFVVFKNFLHNSALCKTVLNSSFWKLFPSDCYTFDCLENFNFLNNIRCTTTVWVPCNYMI